MFAYFRLFARFFARNIRGAMSYRASFWLQVLGMMINNFAMLLFWVLALNRFGSSFSAVGIGMKTVGVVWALASASFGFAALFLNGLMGYSLDIIEGRLDVFLLYPKNPYATLAFSRTTISAIGDIVYGYFLILVFSGIDISSLVYFTVNTIAAGVFFASFLSVANALTFWMGNSGDIVNVVSNAYISFEIYPEKLFSSHIKVVLFSIVPVGLGFWIPIRAIQGLSAPLMVLSVVVASCMLFFSYLLFKAGLRRYESGNIFYAM